MNANELIRAISKAMQYRRVQRAEHIRLAMELIAAINLRHSGDAAIIAHKIARLLDSSDESDQQLLKMLDELQNYADVWDHWQDAGQYWDLDDEGDLNGRYYSDDDPDEDNDDQRKDDKGKKGTE